MTNFTDLGLAAPILKALETQGYVTPTPIQAQAIPPVMSGRDLLGIAQTGTGKTAAFSLPIINRLARNTLPRQPKSCRALILSPTRELASQIADNIRAYSVNSALTVTTVFGGVGHRPQVTALARGVDIVVATPGRLMDHMTERNINFAATEVFVLDEADQMLDLGFLPAIRRIVGQLPKVRQNLFFSATMPPDIGKLAADLLKDPVRVAVTPVATTVERVTQRVILVETHKKKALLAELFANPEMSRALVFTRTKRGADRVARYLESSGVGVASIHGNKSQSQREKALSMFKNARIRALVATDIAARGIDIDDVSHVVNYELPDVPESYVHRIGRTARAGRAGSAISFCDAEERVQLRDIERLTRQTIKAEDRRNDATLVLEKREVTRSKSGGEANGADGEGDTRREGQRPARGGHRQGHQGSRSQDARGRDGQRRDGGRDGRGRDGGDRRDFRRSEPRRDGGSEHRAPRSDGADMNNETRAVGEARPAEHRARPHNGEGQVRGDGQHRHQGGNRRPQGGRPPHRGEERFGRDRDERRGDDRREHRGREQGDRDRPRFDRQGEGRGRPHGERSERQSERLGGRGDGQRPFHARGSGEGRPHGRPEGRPEGGHRERRPDGPAKPREGGEGKRNDLDRVAFLKPHNRRNDRGGEQRRDGNRPSHKANAR